MKAAWHPKYDIMLPSTQINESGKIWTCDPRIMPTTTIFIASFKFVVWTVPLSFHLHGVGYPHYSLYTFPSSGLGSALPF